MKLIDEKSILKNLPLGLGPKETLIFDSIRFLLEMIDFSYGKLLAVLLRISKGEARNVPETFGYVWSIVDNSNKVLNICKKLPWEFPDQLFGHIYYIKEFRNTFQHLDERIDESLLKTQSPFLGVITWTYLDLVTRKFELIQLISGNLIHGPNAEQSVPNLEHSNNELNLINLHTVSRRGDKIKCDINQLICDLEKIVQEFEERFKKHGFIPIDWSKRQDVVIHLKNPD